MNTIGRSIGRWAGRSAGRWSAQAATRHLAAVLLPGLIVLACGCRSDNPLLNFPRHSVDVLTGKTELEAVRRMEDPASADSRRQGILELYQLSYGKPESYRARWKQIAVSDESALVRATAVRALNRARDGTATGVFIRALSDPSDKVRLEGAKALAIFPDPAAALALVKVLNNPEENKDVRIAAADALKHYHSLDVGRALASKLSDRDFAIAWQSRRSLGALTGRDYQYDESAWLKYLMSDQSFG